MKIKVMLDESVTEAAAQLVISVLEADSESVERAVFSLKYIGRSGVKDAEIGEVAAKEGWFVITADRDMKRKSRWKRALDGPPLRQILPGKKVSAVYLSGSIQNSNTFEKVRASIATWPDTRHFFRTARPGSVALLQRAKGGSFFLRPL